MIIAILTYYTITCLIGFIGVMYFDVETVDHDLP